MTTPVPRFAAHRQVLIACRPARWATPGGRLFVLGAVLLLCCAAVLIGAAARKPLLAGLLVWVPFVGVAWGVLVYGLMGQNSVVAAVTVPRHVRVLREVAGLAWVALLVLVAAGTWLAGLDVVAAVTRHAVMLLAFALVARWPLLWIGVGFVPWWVLGRLDPVMNELQALAPAGRVAVVLLLLGVGPFLLALLFGRGGSVHRRARLQQEASRRLLSGRAAGWPFAPLARFGRLMAWPYHRALRVASGPDSPLSPTARLMFVTGPGVHPGVQAWWIGVMALGVLIFVVPWVRPPEGWQPGAAVLWGPTLGVMSMALNPVFGVLSAWRQTRREQALLALLPGIERGGRLNQALARRMGQHYGFAWAGGSLVLAAFAAWAPALAGSLAIVSAALLPLGGFLCTDLSRLPDQASPHLGRVLAGFAGLPLAGLALHHGAGVPASVVVGALLLGSAAWLVARYRALAHRPQALPCGRLA